MPRAKSLSLKTEPMEAKSVSTLPVGKNWVYEPKWDGFRCLAHKKDGKVDLISKSGKPLNRYFPDIVAHFEKLKAKSFVLDGEIVIAVEKSYSFSALQARLHPAASRVSKLAATQPATFILFDMLENDTGKSVFDLPFSERRATIEDFVHSYFKDNDYLILSPQTGKLATAKGWIDKLGVQLDGLVAKDLDAAYQPGERIMQKYKFLRSADCVVGGFRYGKDSKLVGSLLLGLYDEDGLLHHVGFTSAIKNEEKEALTKKLSSLVAAPGFTGKAPGGPSRWSTEKRSEWEPLKPKLVVEVAYDHVTDDRFRHGTTILRWRPDKKPSQCTMEQLAQPKILPLD